MEKERLEFVGVKEEEDKAAGDKEEEDWVNGVGSFSQLMFYIVFGITSLFFLFFIPLCLCLVLPLLSIAIYRRREVVLQLLIEQHACTVYTIKQCNPACKSCRKAQVHFPPLIYNCFNCAPN